MNNKGFGTPTAIPDCIVVGPEILMTPPEATDVVVLVTPTIFPLLITVFLGATLITGEDAICNLGVAGVTWIIGAEAILIVG
jgi:hypothetical protein